jgi:alpha-L-fucosidase
MKKYSYMFLKVKTIHFAVLLFTSNIVNSQTSVLKMSPQDSTSYKMMQNSKSKAISHFNNAKYGMFIHWGLYAIPGGIWKNKRMEDFKGPKVAEWIQLGAQIPRDEYAALAKQFNPTNFDANAIAKLAKSAGMKYLVITAKHHDGFALYDSEASKYNSVDATPYETDIIDALYKACKSEGIDFGLYYSHNIDWFDGNDCGYDELLASGLPLNNKAQRKFGANTWDPSPNSFTSYLNSKAFPQVKELLSRYKDMTTLWYDMPHYLTPKQSYEFYKLAYDYQPELLINSRVGNTLGDFDIPGDNKIPEDPLRITKPWQTVGTTNNSWGFKSYDNDWKSPSELLFWLIEIVSKGGNYMLNIGPDGMGNVPETSVNNLIALGDWLKINGEGVYNTKRWHVTHEGPTEVVMKGTNHREKNKGKPLEFTTKDFWFTTNTNYLFATALVYPQENEPIRIESLSKLSGYKVKSVEQLGSKNALKWRQTKTGLEIRSVKQTGSELGYTLKIDIK